MGTTVKSSSVGSMTTELTTSPVGDAVGCAALIVAALALCGAGEAAVAVGAGGGAGGVLTVSAGGVTVVSPVDGAAVSDPAATPSPLGGASVAVDVSGDVAHVPDVVVAVAVSAPSVVLPDGATASVAPGVHEVSVAAVEVSVAASVLSAVVVVSVEDDDVSVDEIELAVSGSVEVVSAEGTTVSTVCPGGAGTSSALAGAIKVDVEATPTIKTAVQRISRSSRRR